jgi:hypothetical protein
MIINFVESAKYEKFSTNLKTIPLIAETATIYFSGRCKNLFPRMSPLYVLPRFLSFFSCPSATIIIKFMMPDCLVNDLKNGSFFSFDAVVKILGEN